MTTTPPEQPPEGTTGGRPMSYTFMGPGGVARLPMPGNAELAVLVLVEFILALTWIIADSVNTEDWAIYTTVLTSFYLLSRGIAKASRVLEQ
jgi:hypothetical protein